MPTILHTPRLDHPDPEALRAEIRAAFISVWETYERLFDLMAADEAYFRRADPLRHPLIFYLGHTATFFINKLTLAQAIDERVHPRFESIFAIGVDEMSWDDLDSGNYDWPPVAEVRQYRRQVRAVVEKVIDELPVRSPVTWDEPMWVVLMGIEHERIHLETSSVLIRQLPLALVKPGADWPVCPRRGTAPVNGWLPVAGGTVVLGVGRDHPYYGWDNEFGRRRVEVADFQASRFPVTNGEWLQFMVDGGYRTQRWWSEEGWAWRTWKEATRPLFWVPAGEAGFKLRCLAQEIPLPLDWPVEVNQLEAKAYCNWGAETSGKPVRLPTEAEWRRLLEVGGLADRERWDGETGNIHLAHWASSCPVGGRLHGGFGDLVGNVWQWTETPIAGYPGFRVHPLYDDFSTPTFDTRHNLMKGGSWISTGNEATPYSRYAFRRHFQQHAGLRPIISEVPVDESAEVYETDDLVSQYCEFHYGDERFGVPNFPRAVAELCREAAGGRPLARALDLGCAVGRATFELARFCDHVTGIDFSARFIRIGHELQERGAIRYVLPEEGELFSYHERTLADLGLDGLADRVEFRQGDAHNLKPQFTGYDLVLAANLIDRLGDPAAALAHLAGRINPGGLLAILSPYTWLEEFTPRDRWLGGFKRDGEPVTSLDGLRAALAPGFTLLGTPRDVPFVIRETARKHQHTLSQLSVWRKEG